MYLSLVLQVFSRSRLTSVGVGTKLQVSPGLLHVSFILLVPVDLLGHVAFMVMVEVQKSKSQVAGVQFKALFISCLLISHWVNQVT